jgi:hypothetical protein
MNLNKLTEWAKNKQKFNSIDDFSSFCEEYLAFIFDGLQAVIVSRNENHYSFFQYRAEGNFNVTRPINQTLMLSHERFSDSKKDFLYALSHIKEIREDLSQRENINYFVYTCQQSIGAALDALPAGQSNTARKVNGDLFERFMRIIITRIGIDVRAGVVNVPIIVDGESICNMSYQHDLIVEKSGMVKAIGSVKTSSKDRIDKIFIDKFLYNKLIDVKTPHFAIFLNDVQRKGIEPHFGISATFLPGHFKGYSIKLNPLDGVYYCDLRPNMITDPFLKERIQSLDNLLVEDIWKFI